MKKFFSPAMIVALIALFVSLAGNATAITVLVTSKQIKDKTIQTRDIAPATVSSLRGQQGPRGAAGAPGPQGLPGPQGIPGPQGLPGTSANTSTLQAHDRTLCQGIQELQAEVNKIGMATHVYPSIVGKSWNTPFSSICIFW